MSVTFPAGVLAAGAAVGLKASGAKDLALVVNQGPTFDSATVFTANRCLANPVLWSREVVKDGVVKAVDPAQVKTIVTNTAQLSTKLNAAADKVDGVLTKLNGFLATGDSKGAFGEIAAAAKSIHTLADHLDTRTKELSVNLNRFATTGLRQYEALAVDGRKTLAEINRAVRSIEDNPQQFLFGKKQQIPEYSSNR